MEEKQLIKKIKELRQIKPNKDWVFLTKNQILGEKEEIKTRQFSFNWLFSPIRRPAFVLRGTIAAAIILTGAFFYLYYLNSQSLQLPLSNFSQQSKKSSLQDKNLVASLQNLQFSLNQISSSLNNLKNSRNPREVLVMTEIAKATVRNGAGLIKQIKQKSSSRKVLTSLNQVQASIEDVQKSSLEVQKATIESLINDLKQRSLQEEDENRLQKAVEYYNEGKIAESMILLMRIGKNE